MSKYVVLVLMIFGLPSSVRLLALDPDPAAHQGVVGVAVKECLGPSQLRAPRKDQVQLVLSLRSGMSPGDLVKPVQFK